MKFRARYNLFRQFNNLLLITLIGFTFVLLIKYNNYSINKKHEELAKIINNTYLTKTTDLIISKIKSNYINVSHKVSSGEKLNEILKKYNIHTKIFVADFNKHVSTKYFGDYFWQMPKIINTNKRKILNYCRKKKINVIIPTSDLELAFWAKYKKKFNKYKIFPMISDYETVSLCQDKWKFFNFLKKNNIKTPETFLSIKSINKKIKIFIIKERKVTNSRKIYPNLRLSDLQYKIKFFKNPIIQEFITGEEISIDCSIAKNYLPKKIILRRRDKIFMGESEQTTFFRNNRFISEMKKICKLFKFSGHIMFQAIVRNKKISILECNPRIGGASVASIYKGLNSLENFIDSNFKLKKKKYYTNKNFKKLIIYKNVKFI